MVNLSGAEALDTFHQMEALMCQWQKVYALLDEPGPFIYSLTLGTPRVRQQEDAMTSAWMIRAGREGEREEQALREGLAIAGWQELDDITACTTRDELRAEIRETYFDASKAVVANWTGQLWRFREVIAEGDFVVMPPEEPQDDSDRVGHWSVRVSSWHRPWNASCAPG